MIFSEDPINFILRHNLQNAHTKDLLLQRVYHPQIFMILKLAVEATAAFSLILIAIKNILAFV